MPGPVSDSYDPEFGTGENADLVREAVEEQVALIAAKLGPELKNIVDVVRSREGESRDCLVSISERDMRIIRFALNRALASL